MLGTRPDIAYVVIKLSQFSANSSQVHLDKALYIMCYLVETQDYKIVEGCRVWRPTLTSGGLNRQDQGIFVAQE